MNEKNTTGSQEGVYSPEPRVYELGYILSSDVNEGNLGEERDALVALITNYKGIVISEGQPELIDLAYPMSKVINNKRKTFSQGYFGWIKFDIIPDVINKFEEEVDERTSLLRKLLIKTVRENTIFSEQPYKLSKSSSHNEEDDTEFSSEKLNDIPHEAEEGEGDDLTKIEGIGPVIAGILTQNGIHSFQDLSSSKVGDLRNILKENELSQHDPKTWSKQATLAKNGKWDELKVLQDELIGGRES